MAVNPYDQASRYLVRLDPSALLPWFFRSLPSTCRFRGWLDTRNIPFSGEPDRTGDTVACLEDEANPGPLWAVPLEFQSTPDAEMFGRLLEYLGSLRRQQRPPHRPGERYGIVGCLVSMTGNGDSSRDYQLGNARTLLQIEECNLAAKDAAEVLNGIVRGEITRSVLPFIPLMKKGDEEGIIKQ